MLPFRAMLGRIHDLRSFLFLSLCLALIGCGGGEEAVPLPWEVEDLWRAPTAVEKNNPSLGEARPWHRRLEHYGPSEIRDPDKVRPFHFRVVQHLPSPEVKALRQVAGSRLRYDLELGAEPYLTFIPLRNDDFPAACLHRVSVRGEDGQEREVHRAAAPHSVPPGQERITVALEDFAGQAVQLFLEIEPPDATTGSGSEGVPWALWGSPAVYSRRARPRQPDPATVERPNILILGTDTLRADAVGAYGATPAVTPAIDALAAESDLWLEAYSTFNVTNPSFVSLMTGLYGKHHDVYNLSTPLPEERTTLAEIFSAAGYRTFAALAARHLRHEASGLGQGFDHVVVPDRLLRGETTVDATINWLAGKETGEPEAATKPFFAWVHFFDPHTPHVPPAPYSLGYSPEGRWGLSPVGGWAPFRTPGPVDFVNQELGGAAPLYFGEVAYMDRQIDRLLAFLESRGQLHNTLVVFLSDHGENLEEHGLLYAHHGLYESTLHVPLMIRWPHRVGETPQGRRIEGLVQNIDLFPTILNAAGLPVPDSDGEDLRTLTTEGRSGRRAAFSEHAHQRGVRVRTRDWAYYRSAGNNFIPDGAQLYDLRNDPKETRNLANTGLEVEGELSALLDRWLADRRAGTKATPKELTPEEIDRLRSLGY